MNFSHKESALFSFKSERNILLEKDLAVKNNRLTYGTPYSAAANMEGLWAPPYVSSDFAFNMRLCGEFVRTDSWEWFPFALERFGKINGLTVRTLFTFGGFAARTALIRAEIENPSAQNVTVPIQIHLQGGIDYSHVWEFAVVGGANSWISPADLTVEPRRWVKANNDKALIVASSAPFQWFAAADLWESEIRIAPGQTETLWFAVSIGDAADAARESAAVMQNPARALSEAVCGYEDEVRALFSKLPLLKSDNKLFEQLYYRSLTAYIANKWTADEFTLNPYYSTGGMRGGCVGEYLWDFSAGWELHPLAIPEADKAHIKQFLTLDLCKCFAFNPKDGRAFGPWYPVNHEKIVGLIYHYVQNTGDTAFLSETVNGKTVLEWAVFHALCKDDPTKPPELTDYGADGEHHLELRRGVPYHGVLPDLNARRYLSYIYACELSETAGKPRPELKERAARLKRILKERLWNKKTKWFDFIAADKASARYTVQMFKLFNSPVLDGEQEEGLLSHLNETEFLSPYGIHSMSKTDAAYDQADIDNGGGGACTIFAPVIAEKLYRANRAEYADGILERVLWWGERVPYWGDSFVANYTDYRHDTPLQCTFGGVAMAQCILFGIFGLSAKPDGAISFAPHLPRFCGEIELTGLKIHGKTINAVLNKNGLTVETDGKKTQYEEVKRK
ncbi:hypothetical protein FACS1894211_07610 [Clostridia bacterium]|nr:hypothetical protein FACS1894211_07610 [Clostridia bacterium]